MGVISARFLDGFGLPTANLHNFDVTGERLCRYCVGHGCWSGRTPEQLGSVAGFAIASKTSLVLEMLFRSRETKTVHSGWCAFFAQQSKAPHQTPDSVISGIQSNVSNFPSVAGRASVSIYRGTVRVRNVILGYGRVRVCQKSVSIEWSATSDWCGTANLDMEEKGIVARYCLPPKPRCRKAPPPRQWAVDSRQHHRNLAVVPRRGQLGSGGRQQSLSPPRHGSVYVKEPETSENPTQSFEMILWINDCIGFSTSLILPHQSEVAVESWGRKNFLLYYNSDFIMLERRFCIGEVFLEIESFHPNYVYFQTIFIY